MLNLCYFNIVQVCQSQKPKERAASSVGLVSGPTAKFQAVMCTVHFAFSITFLPYVGAGVPDDRRNTCNTILSRQLFFPTSSYIWPTILRNSGPVGCKSKHVSLAK